LKVSECRCCWILPLLPLVVAGGSPLPAVKPRLPLAVAADGWLLVAAAGLLLRPLAVAAGGCFDGGC
jgi:hypothetical protein